MDTTCNDAVLTESLDRVEDVYSVKDEAQVFEFLQAHPSLVPLLLEAGTQLRSYFPGAPLSLERISDPEEPREQLFVGIATGLPIRQAIDVLRRFDFGWWLPNGTRAQGKLVIDVEG